MLQCSLQLQFQSVFDKTKNKLRVLTGCEVKKSWKKGHQSHWDSSLEGRHSSVSSSRDQFIGMGSMQECEKYSFIISCCMGFVCLMAKCGIFRERNHKTLIHSAERK